MLALNSLPSARIRGVVTFIVILLSILVAMSPARPAGAESESAAECIAVDISTSNVLGEAGIPASDPGPRFVRTSFVRLLAELLGGDSAEDISVGFVTFGTVVGRERPPGSVSSLDARQHLLAALEEGLESQGGWTDILAGIDRCSDLLEASNADERRILLLSDGRPERPGAGTAELRGPLLERASELGESNVAIDTVVYGSAAVGEDPVALQLMREISDRSDGKAFVAKGPLNLLEVAVRAAAALTGGDVTGRQATVNGVTALPLDIPNDVEAVTVVVLRSAADVKVTLHKPGGAETASSGDELYVTFPLSRPAVGRYTIEASGTGEVVMLALVRYVPVVVAKPSSTPAAEGTPSVAIPTPADGATAKPDRAEVSSSSGPDLVVLTIGAGGAAALAFVGVAGVLLWRRRPAPLAGYVTVVAGLEETTPISGLTGLKRPGGTIELDALVSNWADGAARADAAGWTIARTEGDLVLRTAGADPLPLMPGLPVVLPGTDVSVTWSISWPEPAEETEGRYQQLYTWEEQS